jgi:hypothetical protein
VLRGSQVLPRQRQQDESKMDVEVMVKERPMQTSEVECEWSIAPNDSGRPTLVSVIPGRNFWMTVLLP